MFFNKKVINKQDLLAVIDPRAFYASEIGLHEIKKPTWNDAGLCPFHDDYHTGTFFVNIENGAFNCFSCNTKGGNVITFTQQLYHLDFRDALIKLASDWEV